MKKILICCGSGIATSTAAANKLKIKLEERGFSGKFTTTQCKVNEVSANAQNYDLIVSTAMLTQDFGIPVVQGITFLTGIGIEKTIDDIINKLGW